MQEDLGHNVLDRAIANALAAGHDEMNFLEELGEAAVASYALSLPTADGLAPLIQEAASATDVFAEKARTHLSEQREVLSTFNVAFFGRTGAGKSTLLSAFGELDGRDVSPGDSDWTTEVHAVSWRGCCRLYDTPGINGWGGRKSREDLEATARRAVEIADVVLLCFDSQSQQASEFSKVANWVRHYGKPTIAVLNIRNLRWRHPDKVPNQTARQNISEPVRQHSDNIRTELASIGFPATPVVAIHSRRALFARASTPYKWFSKTKDQRGQFWTEYGHLQKDFVQARLLITFAFVATHNHFVLDRGGKVFKQSAPVIKLPEGASVEDHLRLLGVLNSSVACFWLKQNSHGKGGSGMGRGIGDEDWEERYEFTGTTLHDFPLPVSTPVSRPRLLDELAKQHQKLSASELASREIPTSAALNDASKESERLRALMTAHQEELDWEYYRIYGLTDEDLTHVTDPPGIALGERTFEIALARRMKDGEETAWFDRHGSTPITDIPDHLPADYRDLIQRRLDAIESNPHIRLLEKPEYKRRWATEPWDKQVQAALRSWLLDRIEDRALWYDREGRPAAKSVAQLADVLDRDEDFRGVLRLWAGDANVATGTALSKLLADEAVPFLATYRYKPPGLEKRTAWEDTWALQRREDNGEKLANPIPVPPKYSSTDFVKTSYWSHRGKLDVPKERFISYPNAGRDTDATELLGWAGWDHADQALALASLISQRIEEGWETPKLVPLLAGLNELKPWVRQWHNEIDPEYGESVADTIDDELTTRLNEHHLTVTDLTGWRPQPSGRGRRTKIS